MLNKDELIKYFCNGRLHKGKGSNLKIVKIDDKAVLYNYGTIIAVRDSNNTIFLNTIKYSRTTSKNQTLIKRYANNIVEVDSYASIWAIATSSN